MKGSVILRGLGASPGRVKGKAKIISDVSMIAKLKEGDILVAPFTTPLLTPAIFKASAIVTDTGGLVCHAAIVAREFGIPCVVGTDKATKVLSDGMELVVDGEKGEVYVA